MIITMNYLYCDKFLNVYVKKIQGETNANPRKQRPKRFTRAVENIFS